MSARIPHDASPPEPRSPSWRWPAPRRPPPSHVTAPTTRSATTAVTITAAPGTPAPPATAPTIAVSTTAVTIAATGRTTARITAEQDGSGRPRGGPTRSPRCRGRPAARGSASRRGTDRRFAAGPVDELERGDASRRGQVPLGPAHQGDDRGIEVERPLGEPVLVPVGVGAVADALEHAVRDELLEAVGEHVARDPEVALHLAVAADAEERLAQDQERPAVARGRRRRARRRRAAGGWACGSLVATGS